VTLYAFSAVKKPPYRIRNWSEYNASLKQRGSGAVRVSQEAVENWTPDRISRATWGELINVTIYKLWLSGGAVAANYNFFETDEKADTHRHLDG
jgi:hypothetical protein